MAGEDIFKEIRDRVVLALKKYPTAMNDEHRDLWGDYKDHVINGTSIIEKMLMDYVEGQIQLELGKLPKPVVRALWWQTEQGSEALIDAEYAFRNNEECDDELINPTWDNVIDHLVQTIRQDLDALAEDEHIKDGEKEFEEDDEQKEEE